MHEHDQEPVDKNLLEEMGYEHQDVDVRKLSYSIGFFMLISTVLMFFGLFCVWRLVPDYAFKVPSGEALERKASPKEPAPLLQSNATAHEEYVQFVKQERQQMDTYGWSDRKSGYVHVPIEDALKKVAAQGLPSRGTSAVSTVAARAKAGGATSP